MGFETFEKQNKAKQDAIIAAGVEEFSQKSYTDARTDVIVQNCGISKGLLFHYFGSKKEFYLYCLSRSLEKLMEKTELRHGDFYAILFSVMDEKLRQFARYPRETHFVNMASRDMTAEITNGKSAIFKKYAAQTHAASTAVMEQAVAMLSLKSQDTDIAQEGILLYSNAVVRKYLLAYQNTPDAFFENAERIKTEIKEFIDLMLYGIVKEEKT